MSGICDSSSRSSELHDGPALVWSPDEWLDEIQMTDTIHHVDCEETTFFEAVLTQRSFVYCAFTCEHEAQVLAHHGVLMNGLMKHK